MDQGKTDRPIVISSSFDSGNIEVVDASDPAAIRLNIRPDVFTKHTDKRAHFQWFYFRVSNLAGKTCGFSIVNAGKCSYPEAWPGYQVAFSHNPSADAPDWKRTATEYTKEGHLKWNFTTQHNTVWFAYFAPYSYERHQKLIGKMSASPLAKVSVIGKSLDGRPIDLVTVGTGSKKVWLIARQHPGESMASWWMEGALKRLTDAKDDSMSKLRKEATVYLVPLMCPDGAVRGHLRTNAAGANLNREWMNCPLKYGDYKAPSKQNSPEVECVLREMKANGKVDVFFDVHGDEEIPDNFFCGGQGIPKWNDRHANLFVYLSGRALAHSDDFQIGRGYGEGAKTNYSTDNPRQGKQLMAAASNAVGEIFDCVSVTLEMPFKDAEVNPDKVNGWSPERAAKLGHDLLLAILDTLPHTGSDGLNSKALAEVEKVKKAHPGTYWWDISRDSDADKASHW